MLVGINEYCLTYYVGFEVALNHIAKLGFDCIDFSAYMRNSEFENDDYLDVAKKYKQQIDAHGLKVSQMHANWFRHDDPLAEQTYKIKMNERFFEVAKILDCPSLVFHATKFTGYYRDTKIQKTANDYNRQLFVKYLAIARKFQVNLTLENMFGYETNTVIPAETIFSTAEQVNEYLDFLGAGAGACLDTGHAYIARQDLSSMINLLSERLQVLHLSDAILTDDSHLIPTLGHIDWNSFLKSLAASSFVGTLSLELEPRSGVGIYEYISYAYQIIREFANIMEGVRNT